MYNKWLLELSKLSQSSTLHREVKGALDTDLLIVEEKVRSRKF